MAEAALIELGHTAYSAKKAVFNFQKQDVLLLNRGAKHRDDQQALITLAQQGRVELEKLLRTEESSQKEADDVVQ